MVPIKELMSLIGQVVAVGLKLHSRYTRRGDRRCPLRHHRAALPTQDAVEANTGTMPEAEDTSTGRRHRRAERQAERTPVDANVNRRRSPAELLGAAALLVAALWAGGLTMALAVCIAIAIALDTQQ
jgi:hypothetical protein